MVQWKKVKSLITGVIYNSVKEARESENISIVTMSRKLKKGKDYVYVDWGFLLFWSGPATQRERVW